MNGYRIYTVQEVSAILRVSTKTVYRIIKSGDLEKVWVRGQIRITSDALQKYMGGGNTVEKESHG